MRFVRNKSSVKKKLPPASSVARELNRWFTQNARDLPWRKKNDPYRIWLSEVMLQQTQVTAVIPYYNRFLARFPQVQDLANATIDEVYTLWAGLGYYSRARNLHRGAQNIHQRIEQGMGFPENRDQWLKVPGVGEYTAGAICSIAYNQREPLVDGNVVRVLSRVFAIGKFDSKKTEIWNLAREIVSVKTVEPRNVNQALMELGALVCKPKNPSCERCPLKADCAGKNDLSLYPPPKPKKEWKHLREEKWVLIHSGKIFLVRNEDSRWRKGLWDFPSPHFSSVAKAQLLKEETSRYVVTTHKIERKHFVFKISSDAAKKLEKHGSWFSDKELPGIPAPVRKFLAKLG